MVRVPQWYNGFRLSSSVALRVYGLMDYVRWCSGFRSSVVYWFVFGGVMVCVPRWCNGVCLSVV